MSIKKPFRKVPVRPGPYYAAQRRLRESGYVAVRLAGVVAGE